MSSDIFGTAVSLTLVGLALWYGPVLFFRWTGRLWTRNIVIPAIENAKKSNPELRKPSVQRENFLITEELTTLDDPMLDDPVDMDLDVIPGEEGEQWI